MARRVFILAGEASGDALGAALMVELKELCASSAPLHFVGVGGPRMQREGLETWFDYEELSIIGIFEALKRYRALRRRWLDTATRLLGQEDIELAICIDVPAFSTRLAARLESRRFVLVQFVAPTVWAWGRGRARQFARRFDLILTLFDFEPPFFTRHKGKSLSVGHPLLHTIRKSAKPTRTPAPPKNEARVLGVFFGSRKSELANCADAFIDALTLFLERRQNWTLQIIVAPEREHDIRALCTRFKPSSPYTVHVDNTDAEKHQLMRRMDLALAVSGTVSLELGACGVPHLVAFRFKSNFQYQILRLICDESAVNLWNVMDNFAAQNRAPRAQKNKNLFPIVPVLLQKEVSGPKLAAALEFLADPTHAQEQRRRIRALLEGQEANASPPARRAAELCLQALSKGFV